MLSPKYPFIPKTAKPLITVAIVGQKMELGSVYGGDQTQKVTRILAY